jgi:hypothetical protein
MDIEQFFTDRNIYNKESTKPTNSLGRQGGELNNSGNHEKYIGPER